MFIFWAFWVDIDILQLVQGREDIIYSWHITLSLHYIEKWMDVLKDQSLFFDKH